jgi:hypothetical protein
MAGFTGPANAAGQALWSLETGMQACIQSSSAQACRQASVLVKGLQSNPSYAGSSHLCKEKSLNWPRWCGYCRCVMPCQPN